MTFYYHAEGDFEAEYTPTTSEIYDYLTDYLLDVMSISQKEKADPATVRIVVKMIFDADDKFLDSWLNDLYDDMKDYFESRAWKQYENY